MRAVGLAGLAACAAAAAFASPAQGARLTADLQLPDTHGRGLLISGRGDEVTITDVGRFDSPLWASYSGPGRTTRHGVHGRLGRFGSIALHFEPVGRPRRTRRPGVCTGGPRIATTWEGTFTGSVRFAPDAGLRGFTRQGTFKGSVGDVPRWNCSGDEEEPPAFDPHAGGVVVDAAGCDGPTFQAIVELRSVKPHLPGEPVKPAHFFASWAKSVGVARVTYFLFVEGGPSTAVFADDLSEGTIRPPPPFHGEAKIVRQGDGWEWTGSLSARFPGRTVSLTGTEFRPHVGTFRPRPSTVYVFGYSVSC